MNELEKVSQDARGWIYRLVRPGGGEVIFIFTRAGFWRGGEYHRSTQHDFLVFGKLDWRRCMPLATPMSKKGEAGYAPEPFWSKFLQDGTSRRILLAPFEAHVVVALEDSLYVEWLEGGIFEKTFVPEMRRLVDAQLDREPAP